jgi:hypothetical protein
MLSTEEERYAKVWVRSSPDMLTTYGQSEDQSAQRSEGI